MSRTKRKIYKAKLAKGLKRDDPRIEEGGDAWAKNKLWIGKKKMKPYSTKRGKFSTDRTEFGITSHDKLITKNANRSLKKGVRQKSKKEIKDEIENNIS